MTITSDKQLVRIRLTGRTCRSKERLLTRKLETVTGVAAFSLGEDDVLTALLDAGIIDIDGLVAAVVNAGLVPEEVLSFAPASATGGDNVQ